MPVGKRIGPGNPSTTGMRPIALRRSCLQDDLVFFVLDTVPHLDLSRFYAPYEDETRGAPPFDPADDGVPAAVCLLRGGVFESQDRPGVRAQPEGGGAKGEPCMPGAK